MPDAKLLLSSSERKALFRAAQNALDVHGGKIESFADDLCDKLDDGGIWNPCFVNISSDEENGYSDSEFHFRLIIKSGIKGLPRYAHDLRMVKDRYVYTSERSVRKPQKNKPPFLTPKDYYGPNWDSKREEAIDRDDERCASCGLDRETHKEQFNHDLHVHHKTPLRETGSYREANKLSNLRTLCFRCHAAVES